MLAGGVSRVMHRTFSRFRHGTQSTVRYSFEIDAAELKREKNDQKQGYCSRTGDSGATKLRRCAPASLLHTLYYGPADEDTPSAWNVIYAWGQLQSS